MSISKAYKEAHRHFGLVPGDGLCLHHKDPTLRHTNRERYNEWRPEDLIVMTTEEHSRLHSKGKKHTEETKKKISSANRDKKRSEETKKKISSALKGQIPWNKGKKHSEESRKKMSKAQKGKKLSEEHKKRISEKCKGKNNRPVAQYALNGELIKIWPSMTDAEKECGFDKSTIAKVCKGKLKQHKGYVWRYAHDKTE